MRERDIMKQEDIEYAFDFMVDTLLKQGAEVDQILGALWLKGVELDQRRGRHTAPTRN